MFLLYHSRYRKNKITMKREMEWDRNISGIPREMCSPRADNGAQITNETGHVYQLYSSRRAYVVSFQLVLQDELIARYKLPRLKKFE